MPLGFPLAARAAADSGCPSTPARPAQEPKLELPPDAKPTSKEIGFEVDVGSDGRVRDLQMDEGSGDGAIDLSLKQTLQALRYDPPQTGCVAYSGGIRLVYGLPAPDSPQAAPSSPQTAPPTKLSPTCTPYVLAFLTPEKRDRKRTGTAVVAVELDAAGTRTAPPVLKQSTGSPVLDAEALRLARTGQYNFLAGGPCAPQPFTYNLELTFQ
jgi:TonB family protein